MMLQKPMAMLWSTLFIWNCLLGCVPLVCVGALELTTLPCTDDYECSGPGMTWKCPVQHSESVCSCSDNTFYDGHSCSARTKVGPDCKEGDNCETSGVKAEACPQSLRCQCDGNRFFDGALCVHEKWLPMATNIRCVEGSTGGTNCSSDAHHNTTACAKVDFRFCTCSEGYHASGYRCLYVTRDNSGAQSDVTRHVWTPWNTVLVLAVTLMYLKGVAWSL